VQPRGIQRAVLGLAGGEVRRLRELRQFTLGRFAAVALRELSARVRRSAVIDSRREENRRIISPEMPLISNPCPSSRATHSTPNRRVSASSRCWAVIAPTAPTCSL
jgi:hypothetical protein